MPVGSIASPRIRRGSKSWRRGSSENLSPASSSSISSDRWLGADARAPCARFLGLAAADHVGDRRGFLELVGDRLLVDGIIRTEDEAVVEQLLARLFVVE